MVTRLSRIHPVSRNDVSGLTFAEVIFFFINSINNDIVNSLNVSIRPYTNGEVILMDTVPQYLEDIQMFLLNMTFISWSEVENNYIVNLFNVSL